MKDIKILELTVENFKGQNFHDKYGANENLISGRNASGKSTRISAWLWLISGRTDAVSPANHLLFDNRVELSPDTPTAKVEAVVSIDEETYKIRREATASFQRKRGTSDYVKSASDSYKFFVDDIERNSGDFKEWISANLCDADLIAYTLSGDFFINRLYEDKKGCRQLIEKLVGNVERSEMQGNYSAIDELLQKYSLDEIDAKAQNMAKSINDRLNEIPTLIRNKEDEIAEIEQTDFVATDREISELEAERDRLDKQMTDLTERIKPQMEAKHEAERTYQMKKEVMEKAYEDWKKSFDTRRQKLTDEIAAIRQQNAKSEQKKKESEDNRQIVKTALMQKRNELESLKKKRERLLAERDAEKAKTLDPSATICPHCGAELQGDKLQAVIDNFEKVKRERIEAIVNEGKRTAAEIEALEKRIADMQKQLDEPLPQVITQPTEDLEKQVLEIANTNTSKIAFLETEQGKALLDDLGSVVIPEVKMPETEDIEAAKRNVNERLVPLYERRGLKKRLSTLRNALDELRIEQKEKGADLAVYERQRQLVKDYKQEQMEILSRKVNDGLKFSRLEVWSKQKDGNIIPDIVIKNKDGVSFATANNASRLVTTIDIQRFFCERLGVNMPIFLDEASTIDTENIPHYDNTQMFLLFRADTSLKIDSK